MFWPKVYSATATVVVQPQKVPDAIVAPTITSQIEDRLQIITQQVLSRSRLMELVDRFNLYQEERSAIAPDELTEKMRAAITIKITRRNYFTITYVYRDAKDVAQVTNALASFYVDSNLRIREQDAVGTSRFLKRELDRMQENLEGQEAILTKFKQEHLHELPEAQEKNLYLIGSLKTQLADLRNREQGERERIGYYEGMIASITYRLQEIELQKEWNRRNNSRRGNISGGDTNSESEPEAIKNEIERLKVFYKDTHPDLQRLRRHLAKAELNKKLKKEAEAKERMEAGAQPGADEEQETPTEQQLEIQLGQLKESRRRAAVRIKECKERILAVHEEQKKVVSWIEEYQQYIQNGPAVSERLEILKRGYETLRSEYDQTHAKWLEADMAANLERTQRGEQFEVVDPAQVPDTPYRPDVQKAIPMAIAAALALAVALSFGLNFIDTSFSSVAMVERVTEFPVLVVVPPLVTGAEVARSRAKLLIIGLIYGVIFVILLAFIYMLMTGAGARQIEAIRNLFT